MTIREYAKRKYPEIAARAKTDHNFDRLLTALAGIETSNPSLPKDVEHDAFVPPVKYQQSMATSIKLSGNKLKPEEEHRLFPDRAVNEGINE